MANLYVDGVEAASSGSSSLTVAAPAQNVIAGNFLHVSVMGTRDPVSATDTAGNTYICLTAKNRGDGFYICHLFAYNVLGHATNVVTVTYSVSDANFRGISVDQYSSVMTSGNPKNQEPTGASGSGTAIASNAFDPFADDLIVCSVVCGNSVTPGSGYTERHDLNFFRVMDKLSASAGSQTADMTQSSSDTWGCVVSTFQTAGGVGGGATYPGADGCGVFHHDPRLSEFEHARHRREWEINRIGRGIVQGRRAA